MLRSIWEMARARTIALPLACMLVLAAAPLGGVVHGLPRARQGPPWPVVVPTEKERFVILPGGKVLVVPAVHPHAPPAIPPDAYFLDRGSGRWVDLRHHHVVVHRDRRVIWRSRSTFDLASANGLSGIVVGARGVAFQVRRTRDLFVAAGRGPERRVATNEWPELWSASGNLITVRLLQHHRFAYLVRSPQGERLTTLATDVPLEAADARATDDHGSLLYWDQDGILERTDGSTTVRLASADSLGLRGYPGIYPLDGGLIELLSRDWHAVILRDDGSVFATASAPTDGSVAGFGDQVAAPDGSAVAYVLTREEAPQPSTVFVLRAGDRRGEAVYRVPAGKGLPPSWHGSWLLFADAEEGLVVIDPDGARDAIDLSELGNRLEMLGDGLVARWPHWSGRSAHVITRSLNR
jgi:hypothetical protein